MQGIFGLRRKKSCNFQRFSVFFVNPGVEADLCCTTGDCKIAAILVDQNADKFNYEVDLVKVETLGRDIHQLQNAVLSSCAETEIIAVAQEFTVLLKGFKFLKSQLKFYDA